MPNKGMAIVRQPDKHGLFRVPAYLPVRDLPGVPDSCSVME
jgi:hypothetical protein